MAKPPEELTATMEEYREKHSDFKGEHDGQKYVMKWSTRGSVLIPVEDDPNDE